MFEAIARFREIENKQYAKDLKDLEKVSAYYDRDQDLLEFELFKLCKKSSKSLGRCYQLRSAKKAGSCAYCFKKSNFFYTKKSRKIFVCESCEKNRLTQYKSIAHFAEVKTLKRALRDSVLQPRKARQN